MLELKTQKYEESFKKIFFKGEWEKVGERETGRGREIGERNSPPPLTGGACGAGKPRDEPAGQLAQEWHIL